MRPALHYLEEWKGIEGNTYRIISTIFVNLLIKEYILKPILPVTNANNFDFAFVYVNDYNIANIITISVAIFVVVVFVVVVVVVDGGVVDSDGVVVVFISIMYPLHFFGAIFARA